MAVRDHGFHALRIARVVAETADAATFVLDVPADLADAFAYRAGQFCTFRATIGGETILRCYSMSSSPDVDDELAVTVKRVPGGLMSNWMLDELSAGDVIDVTLPAGVFCLPEGGEGGGGGASGDLVAYCGGSGITPVFSLAKSALATTDRRVRLLYANRDRDSVIFGDALDALAAAHPDRLEVVRHHDADGGYLDEPAVAAFARGAGSVSDADHYICGPGPFMDLVEVVLVSAGVTPDRVHIERFTPAELLDPADDEGDDADTDGGAATDGITVTIELDGRTETTAHHPGTTLLQTARQVGLAAPSSCEAGSCATCMGRLVEGKVEMFVNNALTDDEVADGWVLTCQSVPTTPTVHVVYGFEED